MIYPEHFQVIVVGGGHAGCEAALASARIGVKTLLLTHNIETIGVLSCNPSMGGIGKGQLMKEIDALGGAQALCADQAGINFKILNRSKGAAMYGHHVVLDRQLYRGAMRKTVESQPNLRVFQQAVEDVVVENDTVKAVITQLGIRFNCDAVILTAGTFLDGKIYVGLDSHSAGRAGDPPSVGLAHKLKELALPQGRLKTGTPPRIDAKSIDFSKLTAQHGDGHEDGDVPVFSFRGNRNMHPRQIPCWVTRTNTKTHEILRSGFDRSPMFTGKIEGVGPRYCPSIEDKINRFADKDSHQIILEPEGLDVVEYYPNGISTSLPFDVQYEAVRSIVGLENAFLTRPGYAVEYNYFDPTGLKQSTESRHVHGLFMAGQIIGTTGYSEAGATGIVSGINAALYVKGETPWVPARHEAYLGVMIDDLTTKGVSEPYRMFTSRAEYRLQLREDNADQRLTPLGRKLGLVGDEQWEIFCKKQEAIAKLEESMKSTWINPSVISKEDAQEHLGVEISREYSFADLLKRPSISFSNIEKIAQVANIKIDSLSELQNQYGSELGKTIVEQVEITFKYSGYITKQQDEVEKLQASEGILLPQGFDYNQITALSTEVKQKLNKHQPENLGQASRISGIPPAAIGILMIYLKKNGLLKRPQDVV